MPFCIVKTVKTFAFQWDVFKMQASWSSIVSNKKSLHTFKWIKGNKNWNTREYIWFALDDFSPPWLWMHFLLLLVSLIVHAKSAIAYISPYYERASSLLTDSSTPHFFLSYSNSFLHAFTLGFCVLFLLSGRVFLYYLRDVLCVCTRFFHRPAIAAAG